jgi:hypothetical protein
MSVVSILERKIDVRLSRPREYVRQRMAEAGDKLNRAGKEAARVELVNEALCRLVELVYQRDADGTLANVDSVTYRLLLPAPWGSKGWRWWGLRAWEGQVLRNLLRARQAAFRQGQRPPLFTYDRETRTWLINLEDYPSLEAAGFWLKGSAITLAEWRRYSKQWQDQVRTAKRQYRSQGKDTGT